MHIACFLNFENLRYKLTMKPYKLGQIAKFHSLIEGENPEQVYVILELHEDVDGPRAKIQGLILD